MKRPFCTYIRRWIATFVHGVPDSCHHRLSRTRPMPECSDCYFCEQRKLSAYGKRVHEIVERKKKT